MKKKILSVLAFLGCALVLAFISVKLHKNDKNETLTINFFNAGDADAALLYTDEMAVLIDTGEKGFGEEIIDYLGTVGIYKLDYLIVSHFDKDHVGGAAEVIRSVEVGKVLQNNYPKDSKYYDDYLAALAEKDISPETLEESTEFFLDGVHFDIDVATKKYDDDTSNNASLIVGAYYGTNSFLFMGDAKDARIADFLEKNNLSKVDVVKVPYHGRELERSVDLYSELLPRNAVVSATEDSVSKKTAKALFDYGAKVKYTYDGDVVVVSDGERVNIIQE